MTDTIPTFEKWNETRGSTSLIHKHGYNACRALALTIIEKVEKLYDTECEAVSNLAELNGKRILQALEQQAEIARLTEILCELSSAACIHEDPRVRFVDIQIARSDWFEVLAPFREKRRADIVALAEKP